MTHLRILHAIRSDSFAGVEQFVCRLAIAQAAEGHTVAVIGGAAERMREPLARANVPYQPGSRTSHVAAAIRRSAGAHDVINTHMTAADAAAAAAFLGRRRGPAVVSTRHFARRRGRFRALPLDVFVRGTVDAELAISDSVAAAIRVPSTVVHSGVDDRSDAGVRREKIVLVAQRLQPEKHTQLALTAFASSGLAADGWALHIAGDGAESARLRALAEELGLTRAIRFLGFRSDVPELMDRASILIAPCPIEGLGLTVLEAMAAALPVVAADAGGHREVLQGLDPRARFAPDDVGAAASALRLFAADAGARSELGTTGRLRQQNFFSVASQLAGTDAVYRAAIARHAGRWPGER